MLFTFDKFTILRPPSFVNYFLKNLRAKNFLSIGDFCALQRDIANVLTQREGRPRGAAFL